MVRRLNFPRPLPTRCRGVGNGNWEQDLRSVVGEAIAAVDFDDAAGGAEHTDPLVQRDGADAAMRSQLGKRQRLIGLGEDGHDAFVERGWRGGYGLATIGDLQCESVASLCQLDRERFGRWGGAVLDR